MKDETIEALTTALGEHTKALTRHTNVLDDVSDSIDELSAMLHTQGETTLLELTNNITVVADNMLKLATEIHYKKLD